MITRSHISICKLLGSTILFLTRIEVGNNKNNNSFWHTLKGDVGDYVLVEKQINAGDTLIDGYPSKWLGKTIPPFATS